MAIVFAIGMLAGAALGPAPEGSLADSSSIIDRAIALLAARAAGGSQASAPMPPVASKAIAPARRTSSGAAQRSHAKAGPQLAANRATAPLFPASSSTGESATGSDRSSSGGPSKGQGGTSQKPARLPPIQHVWLVMLNGSSVAAAEALPSGNPYLDQLVKQGMLLSNYSALESYELAGDAALLPGGVDARLSVIQESGCEGTPATTVAMAGVGPEGPCRQGAQASPAEADRFLQGVVEPILSSPAYRENGLVVITFASSPASTGTSTATGASAGTLALQPVAGALLLSPLLTGATRSSSHFDSISPRTSVASIFRP